MDCDKCKHEYEEEKDYKERCEKFCYSFSCKDCPIGKLVGHEAKDCPIYDARW